MIMDNASPKIHARLLSCKGTSHFIFQRITALALIPLTIFSLILVLCLSKMPYEQAIHTVQSPLISVPILSLILAGVWHMKLGMQMIIEDYIQHEYLKAASLLFSLFFCIFIALATSGAVLKLSFANI